MLASVPLALAEGGGNLIVPDGSLVVVIVLFIIFVFIMNRILFKPVGRVLDEREALTRSARTEARAAAGQYVIRLESYETAIREARAASYRRLEELRQAALQERASLIEQAKQHATAEIDKAKAEIAGQAETARAELEAEARHLAQQISASVLGRTVGGGAV